MWRGVSLEDIIKKYGLATLKIILKKGNRVRYMQILKDFPATSGTLSRTLKALEDKGLIKRSVDSTSRPPVSYYSVTEKGMDWVERDVEESLLALLKCSPSRANKILDKIKSAVNQKQQSRK